jgi:hypothetical protein
MPARYKTLVVKALPARAARHLFYGPMGQENLAQGLPGKGSPKGVGRYSWAVLEYEMKGWARVNNRRQVGSYTGLCPGVHRSDNRGREGSINRCGNPIVRWILIEMVYKRTSTKAGEPRREPSITSSGHKTLAFRLKAFGPESRVLPALRRTPGPLRTRCWSHSWPGQIPHRSRRRWQTGRSSAPTPLRRSVGCRGQSMGPSR